jgi:hypothetical protein
VRNNPVKPRKNHSLPLERDGVRRIKIRKSLINPPHPNLLPQGRRNLLILNGITLFGKKRRLLNDKRLPD